ncbi:MAG: SMC-Scp complex subunit ScpB [Clostridiales bacterium 38-18]|nr:MAG: SMC-Scp complex subunit ScpB [Clostridiales bacterium 38-18]
METSINYKSVIESLLFAWGEPLSLSKIAKILDLKASVVEEVIEEMIETFKKEGRGIQIVEVNKHYQLSTLRANYAYIEQLCATSRNKGLSNSALEVLAIIAYKQPITKLDIEQIRGVNSDGPLQNLVERELVQVMGRLEKIGRPQIYGTTDTFLKSFGFKTLMDLPEVGDFVETITSRTAKAAQVEEDVPEDAFDQKDDTIDTISEEEA